jgi:hypothetical protein
MELGNEGALGLMIQFNDRRKDWWLAVMAVMAGV